MQKIFEILITDINEGIAVISMLNDQNLDQGFGTLELDFSGIFEDEDDDELSYEVASSDVNVVTAAISNSTIVLSEVGNGTATITLTSNDGNGESASDEFIVAVEDPNDAPVIANPLSDVALDEGFTSTQISLTDVFSDPNSDALTFTAISADLSVVSVSVANDQLELSEVGLGTSTITVTADDGNGGIVSDEFTVTVNEVEDALGLEDQVNIHIYPNPVVNTLHVEAAENISVSLRDLNGRLISEGYGISITIDVKRAKEGVYLLTIEKGSEQLTRRIIKGN